MNLQTLGSVFGNQTTLGAIFDRIVRDFAQIFRNFAQIYDKSKRMGVRLYPMHPLPTSLLNR